MRRTLNLCWVLAAGVLAADPLPEKPLIPPPPLLGQTLLEALPEPARVPTAWTIAVVGAGTGTALAVWAFGSALSDLQAPGGPPLGVTTAGLAWGTVFLAASGLALDYLFNG